MSKSRKKKPGRKQQENPAANGRFFGIVALACAGVFGLSYYLFVPRAAQPKRARVQFLAPEKPAPKPRAVPKAQRPEADKPLRTEGSPIDAVPAVNKVDAHRNWPPFFDTLPDQPVTLENTDAYLQFARGIKLLEKAQMPDARAHLARAVELSPGTGSYHAWYAYVLYLTTHLEEGERHMLKARELGYDDPLVYQYLNMILPPPAPDEAAKKLLEEEKNQNPN